jgi:hypothetical protein
MKIEATKKLYPMALCITENSHGIVATNELGQKIQIDLDAINAEAIRLQAEYDNKQYQRDRAAEYPAVIDQLDMLFHGGYDAWKTAIQAVKDKHPKGSA